MKILLKNIFIFIVIGFTLYYFESCNVDKTVTPLTTTNLGILVTNENGQVIGGDYSDWCIHPAVDTFTYVISFSVTYSNQNRIARLRWVTSKEYNNYGFDIERKRNNEYSFIRLNFVQGQGIFNDTTNYLYIDTVNSNAQLYTYRLKIMDIYGNFKYYYAGPISVTPPLNSSYGPVYPNPANGVFNVPFSIPRKDTVTIFFIDKHDTVYIAFRNILIAGNYKYTYHYDTSKYHNVQDRLYIYCGSLMLNNICKNYGDIQFN
jgi:hypothetical protein